MQMLGTCHNWEVWMTLSLRFKLRKRRGKTKRKWGGKERQAERSQLWYTPRFQQRMSPKNVMGGEGSYISPSLSEKIFKRYFSVLKNLKCWKVLDGFWVTFKGAPCGYRQLETSNQYHSLGSLKWIKDDCLVKCNPAPPLSILIRSVLALSWHFE